MFNNSVNKSQSLLQLASLNPTYYPNPKIQMIGCFSYHLVLHPVKNINQCYNIMIQQILQEEMSFRQCYRNGIGNKNMYVVLVPFLDSFYDQGIQGNNVCGPWVGQDMYKKNKQKTYDVDVHSCLNMHQYEDNKQFNPKNRSQQNSARSSLNMRNNHSTNLYVSNKTQMNCQNQKMLQFCNLIRSQYATTLTMPLEKKYKQMVRQILKQTGLNGDWKKSINYYKFYINNNPHTHKNNNNDIQQTVSSYICYKDLHSLTQLTQYPPILSTDDEITIFMHSLQKIKIINAYKYCVQLFDNQLLPTLLQVQKQQQIIQQYNNMMIILIDTYVKLTAGYNNNYGNKGNSKDHQQNNQKQRFKIALENLLQEKYDYSQCDKFALYSTNKKQGSYQLRDNGNLSAHRTNFNRTQRINMSLNHSQTFINGQQQCNDSNCIQENSNSSVDLKCYSLAQLKKYIRNKLVQLSHSYAKKTTKPKKSQDKDKRRFSNKNDINGDGDTECLTDNTDRLIDSDIKQIAFNSIKSIFNEQLNKTVLKYKDYHIDIDKKNIKIYEQVLNKLSQHIKIDYKCYYLMYLLLESVLQNKHVSNNNNQQQQWKIEQNSQLFIISRILSQQQQQQPLRTVLEHSKFGNSNFAQQCLNNNELILLTDQSFTNGGEVFNPPKSNPAATQLHPTNQQDQIKKMQGEIDELKIQLSHCLKQQQDHQNHKYHKQQLQQKQNNSFIYQPIAVNTNINLNNRQESSTCVSDRYLSNKIEQVKMESKHNSNSNSKHRSRRSSPLISNVDHYAYTNQFDASNLNTPINSVCIQQNKMIAKKIKNSNNTNKQNNNIQLITQKQLTNNSISLINKIAKSYSNAHPPNNSTSKTKLSNKDMKSNSINKKSNKLLFPNKNNSNTNNKNKSQISHRNQNKNITATFANSKPLTPRSVNNNQTILTNGTISMNTSHTNILANAENTNNKNSNTQKLFVRTKNRINNSSNSSSKKLWNR